MPDVSGVREASVGKRFGGEWMKVVAAVPEEGKLKVCDVWAKPPPLRRGSAGSLVEKAMRSIRLKLGFGFVFVLLRAFFTLRTLGERRFGRDELIKYIRRDENFSFSVSGNWTKPAGTDPALQDVDDYYPKRQRLPKPVALSTALMQPSWLSLCFDPCRKALNTCFRTSLKTVEDEGHEYLIQLPASPVSQQRTSTPDVVE
ncbi:hypothetical protein AAF712_014001 [Marasmius tenuissimus]|uniref:Uncharacterized protein n=1 Tax=Marasmius tenuissimus TaxID=585030 RepID=A0ABR2ZEA0_9AGAR